MGGGLESRCMGRVYGVDSAVHILSSTCSQYICPSSGALDVELQHMVFCTEFLDGWWS